MRTILAILFCAGGVAVLVGLGIWQLQRLEWKRGVLSEIEARIGTGPVRLPDAPNPDTDGYLPVVVDGVIAFATEAGDPGGQPIRVFGAWRGGTGYRIVAPLESDRRRVMVDLGIVPLDSGGAVDLPEGPLSVTGNLAWPDETGAATPGPSGAEYYARDVADMARFLGTEPVLIVAREVSPPPGTRLAPVGVDGIPNNHLGYAVQWFGLALVWAGMTAFYGWRITRRADETAD